MTGVATLFTSKSWDL